MAHQNLVEASDGEERSDARVTLGRPRRQGLIGEILLVVCNLLYYGFARHLPYSPRPYACGARRIRYEICRHMFRSCGVDVNVEHGALINGGRDIDIGDRSGIGLDAFISGPLIIGRDVIMGPNCTFLSINRHTPSTSTPMIEQGFLSARAPVIEDDVWIGANVTVLPGRRIGTGSIVAAGAVVAADVPPYSVVAGNPARMIKQRQPKPPDGGLE
jgi:maltose O-acetyltransferase